ncbi:MAG TPA: redoxin domain-containing protein [Bryobacteraceae bacterium]|nr:redoxin domain-containing protein [Bryobacteraceae bacterium]
MLSAVGCLLLGAANIPDPFDGKASARVFVFARTDCPITNRYAPELQRIAAEFAKRDVQFWLVYPDPDETDSGIAAHTREYNLPGKALRDPRHELARRAHATISPQAAVFDKNGQLVYSGRIDDRYVDFGKARPAPTTHDLELAIADTLAGKPVTQARTRAVGCYLSDVQ